MDQAIIIFILIVPIIIKHIDLYFYSDKINKKDDFWLIMFDVFVNSKKSNEKDTLH